MQETYSVQSTDLSAGYEMSKNRKDIVQYIAKGNYGVYKERPDFSMSLDVMDRFDVSALLHHKRPDIVDIMMSGFFWKNL